MTGGGRGIGSVALYLVPLVMTKVSHHSVTQLTWMCSAGSGGEPVDTECPEPGDVALGNEPESK